MELVLLFRSVSTLDSLGDDFYSKEHESCMVFSLGTRKKCERREHVADRVTSMSYL